MKLIVTGSRYWDNPQVLYDGLTDAVKELGVTEFVLGDCIRYDKDTRQFTSVDAMAQCYAEYHKIPFNVFQADWDKHGRAAGPLRNQEMVNAGDKGIAFWDGESRGTKDCIQRLRAAGKLYKIVKI